MVKKSISFQVFLIGFLICVWYRAHFYRLFLSQGFVAGLSWLLSIYLIEVK